MQDRIALHEGATKVVYFGENGVRVRDALAGKMRDMPGRDDVVLEDITAKTNSVRISVSFAIISLMPTGWLTIVDC